MSIRSGHRQKKVQNAPACITASNRFPDLPAGTGSGFLPDPKIVARAVREGRRRGRGTSPGAVWGAGAGSSPTSDIGTGARRRCRESVHRSDEKSCSAVPTTGFRTGALP